MKQLAVPTLIISTLLTACAGNSLTPESKSSFILSSQPTGATVTVMGQTVGTTPLELSSAQVFPITYPSELLDKYGIIELSHPGCEPYSKSVSNGMLANGLEAKLKCEQQAQPASAAVSSGISVQERLRKLKEIFDEGLISEQEYQSKRQSILQEL